MPDWITNATECAKALKAADREYFAARAAAERLPLADKIEAYRLAKEVLVFEYKRIIQAHRMQ